MKRLTLERLRPYPLKRRSLAGKKVRIWSGEHGCWWRSGCAGYTSDLASAGIYTFAEAWTATQHCGREKRIAFDILGAREVTAEGPPARPLATWHEDFGCVLWWKFPIAEPPYAGSPLCNDWPGYHTHWTPLPPLPTKPGRRP